MLGVWFFLSIAASAAHADATSGYVLPPPPSELYGDLFVAVQTQGVYPDQKTFVDATPKIDPAQILQAYHTQMSTPGFDLKAFVAQYFTPPMDQSITPPPGQSLRDHIDWLWPQLTRLTTTANVPPNSSLIPLPKSYVV